MIRDPARAVTPAALAELDREPSPNRLADPCERCSFRHAPGPCLVPRVLAPGEEGATISRWPIDGRQRGIAKQQARRSEAASGSPARAAAALACSLGAPSPRLLLCPDCRKWRSVPATRPTGELWRCRACRLARPKPALRGAGVRGTR